MDNMDSDNDDFDEPVQNMQFNDSDDDDYSQKKSEYPEVKCSYCGKLIQTIHYESHERQCKQSATKFEVEESLVQCKYCLEKVPAKNLNKHEAKCSTNIHSFQSTNMMDMDNLMFQESSLLRPQMMPNFNPQPKRGARKFDPPPRPPSSSSSEEMTEEERQRLINAQPAENMIRTQPTYDKDIKFYQPKLTYTKIQKNKFILAERLYGMVYTEAKKRQVIQQ